MSLGDEPVRGPRFPLVDRQLAGSSSPWSGARFALLLTVGVLLLVGCGGDDDSSDDRPPRDDEATGSTTATTQPATDKPEAVEPLLQDLLSEWDKTLTPILAEPQAVAGSPDHRLRAELAASFTRDSPYIADLDSFLTGYISQDAGVRPGPSGLAQQTTLLTINGVTDADHAAFLFCSFAEGPEIVLSSGAERSPTARITQGAGEAVRVDGVWRLHRLRQLGFDAQPPGTPDPCPGLAMEDTTP